MLANIFKNPKTPSIQITINFQMDSSRTCCLVPIFLSLFFPLLLFSYGNKAGWKQVFIYKFLWFISSQLTVENVLIWSVWWNIFYKHLEVQFIIKHFFCLHILNSPFYFFWLCVSFWEIVFSMYWNVVLRNFLHFCYLILKLKFLFLHFPFCWLVCMCVC